MESDLDIILIHGLNNTATSFKPFKRALEDQGWKVHIFSLAGHRKLDNSLSMDSSVNYLVKQFKKLDQKKKYNCIGFSQGALTLQLLPHDIKSMIHKQVLLSPALSIRQCSILQKIVDVLPKRLMIFSFAPRSLRKFSWLSVSYFDLLFKQLINFKDIITVESHIPSLIIVDSKDELVDVDTLRRLVKTQPNWKFYLIDRSYLKFIHIGQYHVTFQPNYFTNEHWDNLILDISAFFEP